MRLIEPLTDIIAAAQRAAELAHQLLAFSGKGRFAVAPLDVSGLLGDLQGPLTTMTSAGGTLRVEAEAALPFVEADGGQIRQLLVNLITNASDALGGGAGTVTIRSGQVRATTTLL